MSTMKYLMKQDSSTIDSVVRTFRLSPIQRNFLLGARRGEGLFATKSWTPMQVIASPKETEMANTTIGAFSLTPQNAPQSEFPAMWEELEEESNTKVNGNHTTSPITSPPSQQ